MLQSYVSTHACLPSLTNEVENTVEFCLGLYCYKFHIKVLTIGPGIMPALRNGNNSRHAKGGRAAEEIVIIA